jgi:tRNA A-37 threonylcarbamoyl transferase component Bud32
MARKEPRTKKASAKESGRVVGGYRIEERIGRGGMGVVFLATHMALDKRVALKVIAEELAEDEGFRERFRREPKLAASIDHPNVIPVFDAGEEDEQLFVAMRYVEGSDLRSVIANEGRLDPKRAARVVAQVAEALDAAHDLGLVHRDVKPGNVLIEKRNGTEHVYLTDFGLTKGGEGSAALTKTGQWVGTPDYVAPEQIHGGTLDRRTDIYALGGVLYHSLAGQPPYGREAEVAKIYAHLSKPPPELPDDVDASPELRATIRRAMAKEASERYATAGELGHEALASVGIERGKLSSETAALTVPAEVPGETVAAPGETVAAPGATAAAGVGKTAASAGATAAAGKGATVPADTPPTAIQPRAPIMERLRGMERSTLVALGALGAVVLAGVGFMLGNSGGGGTDAASFGNSTSAGTLELSFPSGWERTSQGAQIPGMTFNNPINLTPTGGEDGTSLVAGQVDATGPSLLPASFLPSVGGEPPRDDAVELGDLEAYRYADLQPTGFDGQLTVFTVPTTAGVATVACSQPSGAAGSVSDECEQIASTLNLAGAKPFPLGPDEQYASALNKSISGLNSAREARFKNLREAKTQDAQASALDGLAQAYGNAAKPLNGIELSPAVQPANTGIVAALNKGEGAYSSMADAARANDSGGYNSAKTDAQRAEAQLKAALNQLADLGYEVG